ncbi:hypothetical protein HDE_07521 [Halotydeus destructor]|nr:hypothetical protein HDE_07521 [Halotydeus destructor]
MFSPEAISGFGFNYGPYNPFGNSFGAEYDDHQDGMNGGHGGQDYDMFDNFVSQSFGLSQSVLIPLLKNHVNVCKKDADMGKPGSGECRPFYMPCKNDISCAISCGVNDFGCGKCSDTNSFRKFCQCCKQLIPAIKKK